MELKSFHLARPYLPICCECERSQGNNETAYACCLQELYGITVEQLVTIVACENGEVQVSIVEPKKEYFLRLQEYIQEYQDKGSPKQDAMLGKTNTSNDFEENSFGSTRFKCRRPKR